MTKEQLAELLNNRKYRNEISKEEAKASKEAGLIVIFGASDDLLEFRGAIYDEVGMYEGGEAFICKKFHGINVVSEEAISDIMEVFTDNDLEFSLPTLVVKAEWSPKEPDCSWLVKTDLPHATFDIFGDDELFCRGVVIDVKDVEAALTPKKVSTKHSNNNLSYEAQTKEVKQIIIDLATSQGYGDPDFTNLDEIDYKFWEDTDHADNVIYLAQKLANANE